MNDDPNGANIRTEEAVNSSSGQIFDSLSFSFCVFFGGISCGMNALDVIFIPPVDESNKVVLCNND